MHIKRFTDYSLRVLIYLALKENELATIKEVAARYQISKNHLMKVVQDLNSKGFIIATRGNNGGIKLSRAPEAINIGQLIRQIEQDSTLVECFGPDNHCVITPSCKLKGILAEAMDSFFTSLEQYTLADILSGKHEQELKEILTLPDAE